PAERRGGNAYRHDAWHVGREAAGVDEPDELDLGLGRLLEAYDIVVAADAQHRPSYAHAVENDRDVRPHCGGRSPGETRATERYIEDARFRKLTVEVDECHVACAEPLGSAQTRLLDAHDAGDHEHDNIVPAPEQTECRGIAQLAAVFEDEGPDDAADRQSEIDEEHTHERPLDEPLAAITALGRHVELV